MTGNPSTLEPTAAPTRQTIELGLSGYPDVKYRWGPGMIRPTHVAITSLEDRQSVHLYGTWIREDGEQTTDPVDQLYRHDDDWPDWLHALAREHWPSDLEARPVADKPPLADAVYGALWSLRDNLVSSSRDWGMERTDAWLYALLVGWDCEEQHDHEDDCIGVLDEVAQAHGWSQERIELARQHRATLAQAGPNGETEAAAARAAIARKTKEA